MNVDISNSIKRLLLACHHIDDSNKRKDDSLVKMVICDFHAFLRKISSANADERIALFDQIYLSNEITTQSIDGVQSGVFPAALSVLCQIDNTILKNTNVNLGELYVSTFSELGKHYLFNKNDKKDIVLNEFASVIKAMQEYVSSQKPSNNTSSDKVLKQRETKNDAVPESDEASSQVIPEESLEELMDQLNSLTGLNEVKHEVNSLINLLKMKKVRDERGFKSADVSKHLVFLGNPGTGKTTVARILSKIYKQIGVLETGQLVEVDRAGLVAEHVGGTASKTTKKIEEAMGGILFIDEAYTLVKGGNDFGQEAIDTLLKAMEDNRDRFVVIVAGYPDLMNTFIESNPGLKSRFSKNIFFEDYSEEELLAIFNSLCGKTGMHLCPDAKEHLTRYLHELCENKPENFANGREMRNLFERAYINQADRLATLSEIPDEDLIEITLEDLALPN